MSNKLILCEKPSVGKSIAAVLGATNSKNGCIEGGGYIVSWCFGHLLELAVPDAYGEQYAKWRYSDLPILPEKWIHKPYKDKAAQLKIIKELMNRADVESVINACDAGREGELIFRHVYDYAKCKKPIKRLWISSMEDAAIKAGFAKLKDGAEYESLHAAALCREQADWLVGLNSTRLFSVLYGVTLNTGRVQSPTLAMLVKRESEIENFVKEAFYTPTIDLAAISASGERMSDKTAAEAVQNACDGQAATLVSVEKQEKTIAPPKLYDLTTLQREANRLLGFTAQQTLDYAQTLYEKKYLSYPRTDSRCLTSDMRDTAGALAMWLTLHSPYCGGLSFAPDLTRLIDDKRVTDHHAIIPTAEICKADLDALPSGERDILNLVTVRLLCASAPVYVYEAVTATFDCGGHSFTAKGKTVLRGGWKGIDDAFKASLKNKPDDENSEDNADGTALPELSKGQTFDSVSVTVKEGWSKAKPHYTEDTTLAAMENAGAEDKVNCPGGAREGGLGHIPDDAERKGLGTPATRAAILEKLVKSGFVVRSKKNLLPTDKGKSLIAVLPTALTSAKLTANWEDKLLQVQRGQLDASEFMSGITEFMKSIVLSNPAPKPEFAALFPEAKKSNVPALGVCPRCGSAIREGQKGFFCDSRTCGFKLWKANKFWTAKRKELTAQIVTALLKDGKVKLTGLYSEKTGKTYGATVLLDDDGGNYVNFRMEFENIGRAKK
jgi:DNA topoisomerase-3